MEAGRLADLSQSGRSEQPKIAHQFRVRLFFGVAVVVLMGWVFRQADFAAIWAVLKRLELGQVLLLMLVNALVLGLFALRWNSALRAFNQPVRIFRLVLYGLAGFGVSYFTPGPQVGGEPLQILLLKKHEKTPTTTALSSVFLNRVIDMLANFTFLVVGLAALSYGGLNLGQTVRWAWLAPAGFLAFPTVHLFLLYQGLRPFTQVGKRLAARWPSRWLKRVSELLFGMESEIGRLIHEKPGALIKMVAISALTWGLAIAEFALLLSFFDLRPGLPQLVAILTLARLAFLVPIPAGLGALEASLVYGMQLVGFSPEIGIAVAVVIRARDMTFGAFGLWLGSWLAR